MLFVFVGVSVPVADGVPVQDVGMLNRDGFLFGVLTCCGMSLELTMYSRK